MIGDELQYHIQLRRGDVGRYCILPGDPGRCALIAKRLDEPRFVASNREFTTYTGLLDGEPVSVVSTGIGGPSAAIAMEELVRAGADTFIRVGTCGGIALDVMSDDVVIASGATRGDGTSYEYAPAEFPAVSDFQVLRALSDASDDLGFRHHVGIVQCKDSFYGQHSPDSMPVRNVLRDKWQAWKDLGVLASEMESATLFTVAAARHVRCGACFHVVWNQERIQAGLDCSESHQTDRAIDVAIAALRKLISTDKSSSCAR